MRQPKRRVSNALLTGALVLGTGTAVVAGERSGLYFDEAASHGGVVAAEELEDDELHGFVDAAHDVLAIRTRYAERIRAADAADRPALQAEAEEAMIDAIEGHGLEVAAYREIGHLLENDAELRDRLERAAATREA